MNNILGLLCVSRRPGWKQPRNRRNANLIVFLNVFSEGVQVSLLTSVSLQEKKIPPVFRSDKTSAPPSLTKSRERKWDYCEYPVTGTCSIVIPSSTQNEEVWGKTKLLSSLSLPLPHCPFLHPHFHLPSFTPTFLIHPNFPHLSPPPFPHSLPLPHLLLDSLPTLLFLLSAAGLAGLSQYQILPFPHLPFRKMAVLTLRCATRRLSATEEQLWKVPMHSY